jgi:Methylase involved in ubiquinone/menaquinone biosynthesis
MINIEEWKTLRKAGYNMSFNEEAKSWDTKRRSDRAAILAESIRNVLGIKTGQKAMEIGCGTGLISLYLKENFECIDCVDESTEMIKVLENKLLENKITNIYPHSLDFLSKTSDNKKFNVIYSSMVFHHIIDTEEELKLLVQFLKEDGKLIIIDLDKEDGSFHKQEKDFRGHNGFDREEFIMKCKQVGLSNVTIDTAFEGEQEIDDNVIRYSLFICVAQRK